MGGWRGRGVEQGKVERSVHASNPRRTGAIGGADPHTHTHALLAKQFLHLAQRTSPSKVKTKTHVQQHMA